MDVQHQTGRKVHCLSLQQLFCRRKGRWLKAGRSQEPCDRLAHPRVIFDNDDRLVLVGHYSVHALQAEFIAYMDSRKSHCNPGRSAPATARFSFVALTPLNYHSIATATRVETFNRSKKAAAIVLWCNTDRGDGAIGCRCLAFYASERMGSYRSLHASPKKANHPKSASGLKDS